MRKEQKNIDETLLLKVIDNTADEKEMNLFTDWYNSAKENAKHFEQLKKVSQLSSVDRNSLQKNWTAVKAKYESGADIPDYIELPGLKRRTSIFKMQSFIRVAAMLVILFGIPILLYNIVYNPKQLLVSGEDLNRNEPYRLADGSLVYLNGKSNISFSTKFGTKNRELTLNGEAFFEVQPNKEIPFIISTNSTKVKVVGTSFNVFSDQSEQVQIAVVEGVVEFFTEEKQNLVTLNAGEQGTYSPVSRSIEKESIGDPNFIAWKTGILYFDETPIHEVFQLLNDHYSRVMVFEDTNDEKVTLTTTFRNQTLDDVLDELNFLLNINYESRNDTIYFNTNP